MVNQNVITFDSQQDGTRLCSTAERIRDLRLQPQFTLQESYKTHEGKREQAIRYIADFSHIKNGALVVEDVKSKATKTAAYHIKRKLMQERLGIEIWEV